MKKKWTETYKGNHHMRDVLGSALRLGNSVLGVTTAEEAEAKEQVMMQELARPMAAVIEVPVEAWERLWEMLRHANERARLAEIEAAHARDLLR